MEANGLLHHDVFTSVCTSASDLCTVFVHTTLSTDLHSELTHEDRLLSETHSLKRQCQPLFAACLAAQRVSLRHTCMHETAAVSSHARLTRISMLNS